MGMLVAGPPPSGGLTVIIPSPAESDVTVIVTDSPGSIAGGVTITLIVMALAVEISSKIKTDVMMM